MTVPSAPPAGSALRPASRASGRTALVLASSRGLGLACATSLAREGCLVVLNGRDQARLDAAAEAIAAAFGTRPRSAVGDIRSDAGRAAILAACPTPDILVTNNEGPPPGKLADWDHDAFLAALEANMLGPALMIRAVLPGIRARRFGRPEEFGDACAYLCSAQAGYISGQNLQLDGGSYAGLI